MSDASFSKLAHFLREKIVDETPRDTGNLADFATKIEPMEKGAFRIYVSTKGDHNPRSHDGIAPYFVYVNYAPTSKNGRLNRNYHYWDNAVQRAVMAIAKLYGGRVEYD